MKRITISLPDDVEAGLRREARRRGVGVSQVVRERLAAPETESRRVPFAALGRSGQPDTARRVDEILQTEWTPARAKSGAGSR
jgi:Ribbon-helix-helix protein, copG family